MPNAVDKAKTKLNYWQKCALAYEDDCTATIAAAYKLVATLTLPVEFRDVKFKHLDFDDVQGSLVSRDVPLAQQRWNDTLRLTHDAIKTDFFGLIRTKHRWTKQRYENHPARRAYVNDFSRIWQSNYSDEEATRTAAVKTLTEIRDEIASFRKELETKHRLPNALLLTDGADRDDQIFEYDDEGDIISRSILIKGPLKKAHLPYIKTISEALLLRTMAMNATCEVAEGILAAFEATGHGDWIAMAKNVGQKILVTQPNQVGNSEWVNRAFGVWQRSVAEASVKGQDHENFRPDNISYYLSCALDEPQIS